MKINLQQKKFIDEDVLKKIIKIGINFGERLNTIDSKCIDDFSEDKLYLKGEACYKDGYIYRAVVSTQGAWVDNRWEKVGDDITELSKEEVEALIGLSSEDIAKLSDILLDTEVRLDKGWSSSKIFMSIQDAIDTSKAYTLAELGKKSGASYKVVSSTSEMTSESIIYLLPNATNYDMYIVEADGTAQKIGNMDVDLSAYAKTSDIETIFLKKTDATSTYTTQTTFNTHTSDTDIHTTATEKASYVKKTDITTLISATPSDDKVLSEKAIKSELANKLSIKNENKISTLNTNIDLLDYILTNCTEEHKRYYFRYNGATNAPFNNGIVSVYNFAKSKQVFVFGGTDFNYVYNIVYDSTTENWTEWSKTALQTDLDKKIDKTSIVEPASTSTNEQVVGAKTYYDKVVKNNNIKSYYVYGVSGLGLTAPVTFKDVWDKIDYNTYFVIDTDSAQITDLPKFISSSNTTIPTYGLLSIWKFKERTRIEYKRAHTSGTTDGSIWFGDIVGSNCTKLSWYKAYVYKHDDASATDDGKVVTIPFTDTTKYKSSSSIPLRYTVINGICYVSGGIACVSPTTSNTQIFTLPKPKMSYQYCRTFGVGSVITNTDTPIIITVGNSGELNLAYGKAGGEYRCTFSYPISQA